ncbi:MAG: hypothetical protein U1E91_03930 [Moraxella sp.]
MAAGAGKDVQHVNQLLKQHKQMAKMMKMLSDPSGISKMMKAVQGLTKGMGGGGGPLFGQNNQAGANTTTVNGQANPVAPKFKTVFKILIAGLYFRSLYTLRAFYSPKE